MYVYTNLNIVISTQIHIQVIISLWKRYQVRYIEYVRNRYIQLTWSICNTSYKADNKQNSSFLRTCNLNFTESGPFDVLPFFSIRNINVITIAPVFWNYMQKQKIHHFTRLNWLKISSSILSIISIHFIAKTFYRKKDREFTCVFVMQINVYIH